jgi:hypothetical protein
MSQKRCRKVKYPSRKTAEKVARYLSEKYGSEMGVYICGKCHGSVFHVANKSSVWNFVRYWHQTT